MTQSTGHGTLLLLAAAERPEQQRKQPTAALLPILLAHVTLLCPPVVNYIQHCTTRIAYLSQKSLLWWNAST